MERETVEEFIARGGKITEVPAGVSGLNDDGLPVKYSKRQSSLGKRGNAMRHRRSLECADER